jgi:hypothetical protein
MTCFKEYFTKFVTFPNIQISEGWGWFVDIESNNQYNIIPIPLNNKYRRQTTKYLPIPQTINEIPSIRSFKSMRNLHDESMIFKMDEDLEKNHSYKHIGYVIHSICILGIIGIFYGCKFL